MLSRAVCNSVDMQLLSEESPIGSLSESVSEGARWSRTRREQSQSCWLMRTRFASSIDCAHSIMCVLSLLIASTPRRVMCRALLPSGAWVRACALASHLALHPCTRTRALSHRGYCGLSMIMFDMLAQQRVSTLDVGRVMCAARLACESTTPRHTSSVVESRASIRACAHESRMLVCMMLEPTCCACVARRMCRWSLLLRCVSSATASRRCDDRRTDRRDDGETAHAKARVQICTDKICMVI
jgi:hypothetical protein